MGGQSLGTLLAETADSFECAGIGSADLEARLLLQYVFGLNQAGLILHEAEEVTEEAQARLTALAARRLDREPLAYILGEQDFWGRPFFVSPAVLIPRPETEIVLERALDSAEGVRTALDLGTGSGILAVSLALELDCAVTAVDISAAALRVAARNAARHGVAERICFLQGDFFSALPESSCFDLLISNPPYVSALEMAALAPEVGRFEPHLALYGGSDGLDCLRILAQNACRFLRPDARLFLEIGAGQDRAAQQLFAALPSCYADVEVFPDLAGHPRVLTARCTDALS